MLRDRRRKFKNFLLKPRAQLELVLNIVVLTIFFGAASSLVIYFQLDDIFQTLLIMSRVSHEASESFVNDWNTTLLWLSLFTVFYILSTISICILHSHRMIGPTVAFKRQIEALLAKNYKTRIKLRDGDYFQDLAECFNRLAEQLDQDHLDIFVNNDNPDDSHNVGEYYVNEPTLVIESGSDSPLNTLSNNQDAPSETDDETATTINHLAPSSLAESA